MTDPGQFVSELEAGFSGTPWHADALMTILSGLGEDQATWRVAPGINTISEIVQHLTFWKCTILARLDGDPVADADSRDWQAGAVPGSWDERLDALTAAHLQLVRRVGALSPADIDTVVPGKSIPVREMLHGAIYHDAYHAGQIRLLQRIHEERS